MRNRKLYCFDLDVISLYQDGGRGRSILFLVSHLLILLPSEGQSLWANQISSTYLNWCRDITTSVFEKQTSAILEIYFRFRFRPFARNLHIILHQAIPNFVQIQAPTAKIWRHIHFSRWRPRWLNNTSGFVSVDVTAFKRSKSISKPTFVEISQMEADIYFLVAIQNGLGRGQNFFQNQECVNILGCSVTFCEYKNIFLMLVDNVRTIQALFVTKPLH